MNNRTIAVSIIISAIAFISIILYVKNRESPLSPASVGISEQDLESMREYLTKSFREIQGNVQDVFVTSGGVKVLTIHTKIPDIAVMGNSSQNEPPVLEKTIRVSITDKTAVTTGETFNVGDTVAVLLDRGVYEGSEFNALKIMLYSREREIKRTIEYSSVVHGTIKSIGKNSLVLKAEVPDLAKVATLDVSGSFVVPRVTKTYTVTITKGTNLSGSAMKDLKINDGLTAWGEGNLLTQNSFTATRIRKEK